MTDQLGVGLFALLSHFGCSERHSRPNTATPRSDASANTRPTSVPRTSSSLVHVAPEVQEVHLIPGLGPAQLVAQPAEGRTVHERHDGVAGGVQPPRSVAGLRRSPSRTSAAPPGPGRGGLARPCASGSSSGAAEGITGSSWRSGTHLVGARQVADLLPDPVVAARAGRRLADVLQRPQLLRLGR